MIFSSGNKHFYSIGANLGAPLFSIFEELASGKPRSLGGWQFCFNISPLQPWHLLIPKAAMSTTSGTLSLTRSLRTRRWAVDFFLCENSFCHCYLMCDAYVASFFWQLFSFGFFFGTYLPCILVMVFTGLCLAPLDSIKISGFVFSCRAVEWASLLLNLATYALATCIWISISALPWLSEHGLLPLEAVCCARNDFTSWILS